MDWVFADGIGLKLAGIILNSKVSENVNGTDLFPKLCEDLAKNGRSLYLLGAKPGVAQAAASWAVKKYAGLRIAGTQDGYYSQSEESRVIEKIKASQPDVLLVAMGAPKQELWIEKNSQSTQATVTMGVGGLFDFYSGNIKRAPKWMSSMGLEWIFRLMQEPQRMWKRYLIGNWIFMIRIFKIKIKNWKLAK
jgi:N-acetylglucosaminyldiphosphoundecaprenol N-acetyl-beta-D-mannosaminyltransferase